ENLPELYLGVPYAFDPLSWVGVGGVPNEVLVQVVGPALHVQAPWQFSLGMAAQVHTFQHGVPNALEAPVDFLVRPQGALIDQYYFIDGLLLRFTIMEQLVPGLDGIGEGLEYFLVFLGMFEFFLDHKSTPYGIVGRIDGLLPRQLGTEPHAIGMEGQEFLFEHNVTVHIKGNLPLSIEDQDFPGPQAVNTT